MLVREIILLRPFGYARLERALGGVSGQVVGTVEIAEQRLRLLQPQRRESLEIFPVHLDVL